MCGLVGVRPPSQLLPCLTGAITWEWESNHGLPMGLRPPLGVAQVACCVDAQGRLRPTVCSKQAPRTTGALPAPWSPSQAFASSQKKAQ